MISCLVALNEQSAAAAAAAAAAQPDSWIPVLYQSPALRHKS